MIKADKPKIKYSLGTTRGDPNYWLHFTVGTAKFGINFESAKLEKEPIKPRYQRTLERTAKKMIDGNEKIRLFNIIGVIEKLNPTNDGLIVSVLFPGYINLIFTGPLKFDNPDQLKAKLSIQLSGLMEKLSTIT